MRVVAFAVLCAACSGEASPSCATAMSGAGTSICIARHDGALVCWGGDSEGELGDGGSANRPTPARVPLADVIEVGAGEFHTCAVDAAHDGWCWGYNDVGEVGDGTTTPRPNPTKIGALAGMFAEIRTGQYHSCAILLDGTVWCWGSNDQGQLGTGTMTSSALPVQVTGLAGASKLTLGDRMACVILGDRTTACWGADHPIGTSPQATAIVVPALANAVDVAEGCHRHGCAALADGSAWCWGDNSNGALGDGTMIDSATPVRVSGLANVVQVAVGAYHSCARTHDGEVWCWGANDIDQRGAGNVDNALVPVRVASLPPVDDLVAGCTHTCARAGSAVYCWGANLAGELGDGTFTNRIGPVRTLDVCGL